jgi:hypothetical protein
MEDKMASAIYDLSELDAPQVGIAIRRELGCYLAEALRQDADIFAADGDDEACNWALLCAHEVEQALEGK